MYDFLAKVQENVKKNPNQKILSDDTRIKGITWAQADQVTSKVYQYLQNQGIGRNDFVMICLPRGMQPLLALLGILKNGSAFVIVEDNYAPERIEFIKKDCGSKLVIDSDCWEKILDTDPKEGYEQAEEHDLAFAVYTSGTTGNPKGVLHEYGNIERMIASVAMEGQEPLAVPGDRFALVAPLNFVASLLISFYGFYFSVWNFVVAYATIKNPVSIGLYLMKNRITGTFLTPSLIRRMKAKPAFLKFCIVGSEPANGIYLEGLKIHNFYLMSESGFAVTHFEIDKAYEQTPIGDSEFGHKILLLDEDGQEVPLGEEGEICFENKYARGYMNLPEETQKAFRDGLYHTGDLGYRSKETGLIHICGRLNDMVKINGNRVEPGEIEEVAKKVLGIEWAAARIFDDGRQVYICLYYLDKKLKVDYEITRKALGKYLPYYMLPSYFIQLDSIPLRPNGKMDRKALPAPAMDEYRAAYEAPGDELEKALCDAFAEVLGIENVSIHDDFYQLGGDSMGSMDVLVNSGIKGLTVADIFAGHTPKKIAEIYRKKYPDGVTEDDDERDERSRKMVHPLDPFQSYMIDYQLYTPISTMMNLYSMMKFSKKKLDIHKMAEAIYAALKNHPVFATIFTFNEDGEIVQSYNPDLITFPEIRQISEIEIDIIKDALVRPFKIINNKLYRMELFETETNGYIFFDVHHTIFDGTSLGVIMQDIIKSYYEMPLERDYYYKMLLDREEMIGKEAYLEDKAYFESLYEGEGYSVRPKLDFATRENALGHHFVSMATNEDAMQKVEDTYGISRNAFYGLVTMLTIAAYNHASKVKISWTYNGRDDLSKMNTIGLLLCDLPLAIQLTRKTRIVDLYKDVQEQVAGGIQHSAYPFDLLGSSVVEEDCVCFLYQEDIRDTDGLADLGIETVEVRQNKAASGNILDIEILDGKEGLGLYMDYTASCYKKESIERFTKLFLAIASVLQNNVENEKLTVFDVIRKVQLSTREFAFLNRWIK